jgi:hypothetical protein
VETFAYHNETDFSVKGLRKILQCVFVQCAAIGRSEVIMPRIVQKHTGEFCEGLLPKNPFRCDKRKRPIAGNPSGYISLRSIPRARLQWTFWLCVRRFEVGSLPRNVVRTAKMSIAVLPVELISKICNHLDFQHDNLRATNCWKSKWLHIFEINSTGKTAMDILAVRLLSLFSTSKRRTHSQNVHCSLARGIDLKDM